MPSICGSVAWFGVMAHCHNVPHAPERCRAWVALVRVLLSAEFQQLRSAAKSPSIPEPCAVVSQSRPLLQH